MCLALSNSSVENLLVSGFHGHFTQQQCQILNSCLINMRPYVVCIIDAGNSSSANSSQEFHFASPKDSLHQAWLLLAALALFIACVASSSGCQFISWLKTT